MKEHGVEHFYIELIEEHPCENGEQLRKREGHYIREIGTLNKKIDGRTKKEYLEENRERIRARVNEYRANRRKETYTCVCGSTCCIIEKSRHERTNKHLTFSMS